MAGAQERNRGVAILSFLEAMSPNLHDDISELWDEVQDENNRNNKL
jgi:hypothetical protein